VDIGAKEEQTLSTKQLRTLLGVNSFTTLEDLKSTRDQQRAGNLFDPHENSYLAVSSKPVAVMGGTPVVYLVFICEGWGMFEWRLREDPSVSVFAQWIQVWDHIPTDSEGQNGDTVAYRNNERAEDAYIYTKGQKSWEQIELHIWRDAGV